MVLGYYFCSTLSEPILTGAYFAYLGAYVKTGLTFTFILNPLNPELNPICHLLALLGRATIVVVSRLRVNI
jgi:drug/metabolite transporter superfamily protein YnfA